jgi:hypothetical protein
LILLELYNSVGAGDFGGWDTTIPKIIKGNSIPFSYCAFKSDVREAGAIKEYSIFNFLYAVGYYNTG